MPAPKIKVQPEPFESGKVVFLTTSPGTSGAKARGRVFLRLDITNNEGQTIQVQSVTVSFPGSAVGAETKAINMGVGVGKNLRWWFQQPQDDVVFDIPGPSTIKLSFKCQGFTDNADFTFPLAPHTSPVAGGAYLYPAGAADLAVGEFWTVNGCTHGMGAEGSQSFAYDMGVWGINHDDGSYGWLVPGGDWKKNKDYRVWGKHVRAMADGVVLNVINDCPNNPAPLPLTGDKAKDDALAAEQAKNYWGKYESEHGGFDKVHGGAGNHFYIQHGTEVVLYAHMQKGTLNSNLLNAGAKVKAGEQLGLAGNSGSSSAPHLHIHAVKSNAPETGPLRPFILKDMWAIDNDLIMASPPRGLWARVANQGIPEGNPTQWDKKDCFIWPDDALPEWPEIVKTAVPEGDYQTLANKMKADGFRVVWLDAFTIEPLPGTGLTYFNLIFRPATGVIYESRHGLSGAEYQAEFDKWVKDKKYRLVHLESYYSHALNRISYAPIFEKSPGPGFSAYHGLSKADHQTQLDDLTKNHGLVPVKLSVVSRGGERWYTGLYEKRSVGKWEVKSTLSVADYQQKFTDKGLNLAYINSYLHGGDINIVAIWHQNITPPYVEHHLDQQELDTLLKKERKAGLYLRALTGYQRGIVPNFAAIFNK